MSVDLSRVQLNWDRDPKSFYWAGDGTSPASVNADVLTILDVPLRKLDSLLAAYQGKQPPNDFWAFGTPEKRNGLIRHLSGGGKITPPQIAVYGKGVDVAGGNHRLVLCRAKALQEIPLIIERMQQERFEELLRTLI
jgi:hypothetical protein